MGHISVVKHTQGLCEAFHEYAEFCCLYPVSTFLCPLLLNASKLVKHEFPMLIFANAFTETHIDPTSDVFCVVHASMNFPTETSYDRKLQTYRRRCISWRSVVTSLFYLRSPLPHFKSINTVFQPSLIISSSISVAASCSSIHVLSLSSLASRLSLALKIFRSLLSFRHVLYVNLAL